jgi:MHS family proline/betaine transporter-like MFS transporter
MAPASTRRIIAAGAVGNVLEWYDFAIYGYFAPVIGRTYFPGSDPTVQLLSAFGVFAIGFLMRPIGGALIGQLGDRFGRANALTVSIMMMAIPTFIVAILPSYVAIGVAAPIILTLLRMVQGLSLGGESTTSMVFLVENAPLRRRGFVGALACVGSVTGILLGSATGVVLARLFDPAILDAWAWRIPFAVGLLIGVGGLTLRRAVGNAEPPVTQDAPSLITTLREHHGLILRIAGLTMVTSVGFYLMFVYAVTWMQSVDGLTPATALSINTISMLVLVPAILLAGWASDHVGRRPIFLFCAGMGLLAVLPLFHVMEATAVIPILLGQLGFAVFIGALIGVQPAMIVESAPARSRCTVVALGFNVTLGVIGGLTPLVATWLVHHTNNPQVPALMLLAAAAVSFVTVGWFFRPLADTRLRPALTHASTPL